MVEDGGEYSCTAENRAGRTSHSARLNVYGMSKLMMCTFIYRHCEDRHVHKTSRMTGMPYIRLIPKVTAVAGETLQLKCPVAGYPIEEIHWERGGRELPDDLRQKVLPDGTLLVNPVQKQADSGVYTCWARNKQGHSARRSGEIAVIGTNRSVNTCRPYQYMKVLAAKINVLERSAFPCRMLVSAQRQVAGVCRTKHTGSSQRQCAMHSSELLAVADADDTSDVLSKMMLLCVCTCSSSKS